MDVPIGGPKKLMKEYNEKGFNIKGVWLTEFAGAKADRRCNTIEKQRELLEKWLGKLLGDDDVTAIAWFSYDGAHSKHYDNPANLWDYKTDMPNALGQKYFEMCSTQKYN